MEYSIVDIPGGGESVGDVRGGEKRPDIDQKRPKRSKRRRCQGETRAHLCRVGQDSAASPAPGPRRVQDGCNWHTRAHAIAAREKGTGRQALGGRSVGLVGRLAQDWLGTNTQ